MLDSLVRVSRRVGGAADLLATEMQAVPVKTLAVRACSKYPPGPGPGKRGSGQAPNFTHSLGPVRAVRRVKSRENATDGSTNANEEPLLVSNARAAPPEQPVSPAPTSWTPPFTTIQFHVLLNSLFKVLFNFPSRYLFAIGLGVIFSLTWSLPRTLSCTPKQLDSGEKSAQHDSRLTGLSPSTGRGPSQGGLGLAVALR